MVSPALARCRSVSHPPTPPERLHTNDRDINNTRKTPDRLSNPDNGCPGLVNQLQQPQTRPISQEQLVAEVKGIYAGLVIVESKCIEADNAQLPQPGANLNQEQWQALIGLHRTLLHEHHDFFLASQHPSASQALRRQASKYAAMPARMWRHGMHSFLKSLRQHLGSSEDIQCFIYMAYSMMALLYETVPALEETWMGCLRDLGRYRMAIEDGIWDIEIWPSEFLHRYSKTSDIIPTIERLHRRLAVLSRACALLHLHHHTKWTYYRLPLASERVRIENESIQWPYFGTSEFGEMSDYDALLSNHESLERFLFLERQRKSWRGVSHRAPLMTPFKFHAHEGCRSFRSALTMMRTPTHQLLGFGRFAVPISDAYVGEHAQARPEKTGITFIKSYRGCTGYSRWLWYLTKVLSYATWVMVLDILPTAYASPNSIDVGGSGSSAKHIVESEWSSALAWHPLLGTLTLSTFGAVYLLGEPLFFYGLAMGLYAGGFLLMAFVGHLPFHTLFHVWTMCAVYTIVWSYYDTLNLSPIRREINVLSAIFIGLALDIIISSAFITGSSIEFGGQDSLSGPVMVATFLLPCVSFSTFLCGRVRNALCMLKDFWFNNETNQEQMYAPPGL
ncbi:hypothetical protein F4810DRAFT_279023 [Camillea tinctor]|nr:hypothetical protein F4810DRAFT_279023 [Camillea tinctor]